MREFEKVKPVMDRGLYSETNINGLLGESMKFIIAVGTHLSYVRNQIDQIYDSIRSFDNLDEQSELYSSTIRSEWDFQKERPYKKDVTREKRRVYLNVYFNIQKYADEKAHFSIKSF